MVDISAPFLVNIDITNKCNLKCIYCYSARDNEPTIYMNHKKCNELIEELFDFYKVFHITIAGGEPFMHPDILEILSISFLKYSPRIVLLTNGTKLLDDYIYSEFSKICNRLKQQNKSLRLQISIDSIDPNINDRQRNNGAEVLKAIDRIIHLPVEIQLACVVTKYNIDSALSIITSYYPAIKNFHYMNIMPSLGRSNYKLYSNLKLSKSQISDFNRRINFLEKEYMPIHISKLGDDYEHKMGKAVIDGKGCLAGTTSIEIGPDLSVKACCMSNNILGNLLDNDFTSVWYSEKAEAIRKSEAAYCHFNE